MIRRANSPRLNALWLNAFELFIAVIAIFSCIAFFVEPQLYRDAALSEWGDWRLAWELMYGVGGLCVFVGLVRLSPRLEVAGLCLFSAAVSINVVAVLSVYGVQAWPSIPTFAGLVFASVVRSIYLIHLHRIYQLDE